MEIIRAAGAGFCMGVSLALNRLETALAEYKDAASQKPYSRICTLGPIIHNPQVLKHFADKGVVELDDPRDALAGDFVLIRAHGIPRDSEHILRGLCCEVRDATCPKVKKAQLAISRATADGSVLLLFGEEDHPEVRGLVSYAAGRAHVFGSRRELERLDPDPAGKYVLASQTTQDREIFESITAYLRHVLPRLTILSTICDATRNRQLETMELAASVDVMVIVGGKSSGNTRRLADLSCQAGIDTYHVESPDDLRREWFCGKKRAGLTAGASTPGALIDSVQAWLASNV